MQHCFTVIGEPVAKQRPRVTSHGTYTPQKTINYSESVKWSFIQSLGGKVHKIIDFPIQVKIVAYFNCPKSKRKKDGRFMIIKSTKPDVDNIAKSILDSLNKIAWIDDSLVYELIVSKYHTIENPRCDVTIMW